MLVHINDSDKYHEYKNTGNRLIVVDFSASWCGPCKRIYNDIVYLSELYPEAIFLHVDIEEMDGLEDVQDIKSIPTFKLFKNNTLLLTLKGADVDKLENGIIDNIAE